MKLWSMSEYQIIVWTVISIAAVAGGCLSVPIQPGRTSSPVTGVMTDSVVAVVENGRERSQTPFSDASEQIVSGLLPSLSHPEQTIYRPYSIACISVSVGCVLLICGWTAWMVV